jgi:hypothetical protein
VNDTAGDQVFASSVDTVLAERIAGHARAQADARGGAPESANRTESGRFDAEPLAVQDEECRGCGRMPHPVVMVVMAAAAAFGLVFMIRRVMRR